MLSLVIILNVLSEVEFFKDQDVSSFFPFYVSLLNSTDLIFEMYPFIFLLTTQIFFIDLFNDNQIQIFKYSGLKNSRILNIISGTTFVLGILIITIFYSLSSNLKNIYLEIKNDYSMDNKYLAVITNNGLWIKDIINENTRIINATKIDGNFLVNVFISEFDDDFNLKRNIVSKKIDIKDKNWIIYNPKIYIDNNSKILDQIIIKSNFDYLRVQSLFSNLSSLSLIELIELRNNYKQINYSTTEIDLQLQKLISFPLYFTLMTILAAIIMFNTKQFKSFSLKITIGLFICVIIYYINNFFYVLGDTGKIPLAASVWAPLFLLLLINTKFILNLNEK
jgi:lipopolysaccharide export system permease protein